MTTLPAIMRMTPLAAASLHAKAVAGDPAATKDFLLYSAWKKIKACKGYTPKAKADVLRILQDTIEIEVIRG